MPCFVVRRSYRFTPFGLDKTEREIVEHVVVQAESAEAARDLAVSRSSVGAIAAGMRLDVTSIDWTQAESFHATYDREPIADNHASTGAKLILTAANSQSHSEQDR